MFSACSATSASYDSYGTDSGKSTSGRLSSAAVLSFLASPRSSSGGASTTQPHPSRRAPRSTPPVDVKNKNPGRKNVSAHSREDWKSAARREVDVEATAFPEQIVIEILSSSTHGPEGYPNLHEQRGELPRGPLLGADEAVPHEKHTTEVEVEERRHRDENARRRRMNMVSAMLQISDDSDADACAGQEQDEKGNKGRAEFASASGGSTRSAGTSEMATTPPSTVPTTTSRGGSAAGTMLTPPRRQLSRTAEPQRQGAPAALSSTDSSRRQLPPLVGARRSTDTIAFPAMIPRTDYTFPSRVAPMLIPPIIWSDAGRMIGRPPTDDEEEVSSSGTSSTPSPISRRVWREPSPLIGSTTRTQQAGPCAAGRAAATARRKRPDYGGSTVPNLYNIIVPFFRIYFGFVSSGGSDGFFSAAPMPSDFRSESSPSSLAVRPRNAPAMRRNWRASRSFCVHFLSPGLQKKISTGAWGKRDVDGWRVRVGLLGNPWRDDDLKCAVTLRLIEWKIGSGYFRFRHHELETTTTGSAIAI